MSCSVGGGERGGGRSSGADGFGARERGRGSCWWLRVRGDALSTLVCSDMGCSAHGCVCVIAGGEELTASVEDAARGRERAQGGGGKAAELTAISRVSSAARGRSGVAGTMTAISGSRR